MEIYSDDEMGGGEATKKREEKDSSDLSVWDIGPPEINPSLQPYLKNVKSQNPQKSQLQEPSLYDTLQDIKYDLKPRRTNPSSNVISSSASDDIKFLTIMSSDEERQFNINKAKASSISTTNSIVETKPSFINDIEMSNAEDIEEEEMEVLQSTQRHKKELKSNSKQSGLYKFFSKETPSPNATDKLKPTTPSNTTPTSTKATENQTTIPTTATTTPTPTPIPTTTKSTFTPTAATPTPTAPTATKAAIATPAPTKTAPAAPTTTTAPTTKATPTTTTTTSTTSTTSTTTTTSTTSTTTAQNISSKRQRSPSPDRSKGKKKVPARESQPPGMDNYSFMYNIDSRTLKHINHLLPPNIVKVFDTDFYSNAWMEWRSGIETGEIPTDVFVIPDRESKLAVKYKALHPEWNVFVQYAVAFVLGRHISYVSEIWKGLPINGTSNNPIALDDDSDSDMPTTSSSDTSKPSHPSSPTTTTTSNRSNRSTTSIMNDIMEKLSHVPDDINEEVGMHKKKIGFLSREKTHRKRTDHVHAKLENLKQFTYKLHTFMEAALCVTTKVVPVTTTTSTASGVPILEDASKGTFSSPVPVYNNVDDDPFPTNIKWVPANIYSPDVLQSMRETGVNIQEVESSEVLGGFASSCSCCYEEDSASVNSKGTKEKKEKKEKATKGPCLAGKCDCMKEMQNRVPYTPAGTLALSSGFPIYECNKSCSCGKDCQNRLIQHGSTAKLEIYKTAKKGWGVRAAEPIRNGTFVCEYIGEIIFSPEAEERGIEYDRQKLSYLYDLDYASDSSLYVIDAYHVGNVARFINHSCDPNLVNMQFWINHHEITMPRIAFFAQRNIKKGEELSFDYHYEVLHEDEEDKDKIERSILCQCGRPGAHRLL